MLRLLGPIELGRPGAMVALGGPKQQAVLALLACAGRPVSADRLTAQLWGERPGLGRPKRTLHVYISTLRKALAPFGLQIVGSGQDYRLEGPRELVDLYRFEDLIALAGKFAAGQPAHALALYDEAERLWRGIPFVQLSELDDVLVASAAVDDAPSRCDRVPRAGTRTWLCSAIDPALPSTAGATDAADAALPSSKSQVTGCSGR